MKQECHDLTAVDRGLRQLKLPTAHLKRLWMPNLFDQLAQAANLGLQRLFKPAWHQRFTQWLAQRTWTSCGKRSISSPYAVVRFVALSMVSDMIESGIPKSSHISKIASLISLPRCGYAKYTKSRTVATIFDSAVIQLPSIERKGRLFVLVQRSKVRAIFDCRSLSNSEIFFRFSEYFARIILLTAFRDGASYQGLRAP